MELGYIGLGKMGFNMVERLIEKGHRVVAFDRNEEAVKSIAKKGAATVESIEAVVFSLTAPCVVWIMVPHQAVDAVLKDLVPRLGKGDTIIDGGNSPYKESMRRARELEAKGIDFLDAGVSGGPSGARTGACIMVGGKQEVFRKFEALFRDLSVEGGYGHMGMSGAGHFVQMVHNGIEYSTTSATARGNWSRLKWAISCWRPSSKSKKSSFFRSFITWPALSFTVASTSTRFTSLRITGPWTRGRS